MWVKILSESCLGHFFILLPWPSMYSSWKQLTCYYMSFFSSTHKMSPSRIWKARAELSFAFRDRSYIHGEMDINKGILPKQSHYSKCQCPSTRCHWNDQLLVNLFFLSSLHMQQIGVLSELNSCKQEHSTWENSQNSFWHFQPQNVRICQGLKHWISLPHIKKDNISFLDSETLSNLHPTAIDGVQNSIRAACGYHAESRIFTHLLRSERVSMPRIWKHHVMSHTEVQSQYYRMKAATRKQPRNSQEYTPAPLQPWANEKLPALLTAPSRARHGKYIIHTLRTVTKLELKM